MSRTVAESIAAKAAAIAPQSVDHEAEPLIPLEQRIALARADGNTAHVIRLKAEQLAAMTTQPAPTTEH